MLETLTKEQEKLMKVVRDEWMTKIFSNEKRLKFNKKKAIDSINWLYEFSKLEKPKYIVFLDSPLGIQFAANMLKQGANVGVNVGANVWDNVGDNVGDNVRANVRANVWDNVGVNVGANVGDNVWDNVGVNVGVNVWANVGANVRAKLQYFDPSYYGRIEDYGWVSFYDFFQRLNIFHHDGFNKFVDLLNAGIYEMITLKDICFVSRMPTKVWTDLPYEMSSIVRLHSTDEAAIQFSDGYEMYCLWGVRFEKDLWEKVVKNKLTFKEVMGIENMEQRMAALKAMDPEMFLYGVKHELLDKSERGNELYKVSGVFPQDAYFLKYSCPSTGRVYMSGIDPNFVARNKKADACMAWKLGILENDYKELVIES